eukprot:754897-Hanusia_phi.AAC.3
MSFHLLLDTSSPLYSEIPQYVRPLSPSTLRNIIREEMSMKKEGNLQTISYVNVTDVRAESGSKAQRSQRQGATLDDVS